jgi:hypothetical protein
LQNLENTSQPALGFSGRVAVTMLRKQRLKPAPAAGAECVEGWARRRDLRSVVDDEDRFMMCACGHEGQEHSTGGECMVPGCRCKAFQESKK